MPHGAGILGMPKGKPIMTKKTQMEVKQFVTLGMKKVIKKYWWAFLVPPAIIMPGFIWTGALIWLIAGALLVTGLYLAFWYLQFYGLSMHPQGKMLFEKQLYAITHEYLGIMKKETDPQGAMIPWTQVQLVEKTPTAYVVHVTLAQIMILPYDIFQSQQDLNFTEAIMRKHGLLPGKEVA